MAKIQKVLGVSDFEVDIWFCSDGKIRELNREWRRIGRSTDILSFPVNDVITTIVILYTIVPYLNS